MRAARVVGWIVGAAGVTKKFHPHAARCLSLFAVPPFPVSPPPAPPRPSVSPRPVCSLHGVRRAGTTSCARTRPALCDRTAISSCDHRGPSSRPRGRDPRLPRHSSSTLPGRAPSSELSAERRRSSVGGGGGGGGRRGGGEEGEARHQEGLRGRPAADTVNRGWRTTAKCE